MALPDFVRASAALPFGKRSAGLPSCSTAGASSGAAAALRRPSLRPQRSQVVSAEQIRCAIVCSCFGMKATGHGRRGVMTRRNAEQSEHTDGSAAAC